MRGFVRPLVGLLIVFLAPLLAGCIEASDDRPEGDPVELSSLQVYEYRYGGDDVVFQGYAYGSMARLTNPGDHHIAFVVVPLQNETVFGPAGNASWETFDTPTTDVLAPGESRLYLFQTVFANETNETGFRVDVIGDGALPAELDADAPVLESGTFTRAIDYRDSGVSRVIADQHVRTATVGVWSNGTSFYTNIADLNADTAFPTGYDRNDFGGDPLPVYVYDEDRSEQPSGSKDTCHFTTVPGYNALLKTQVEFGTNVRWLAPEEAYTRAGAEDHDLYGDVLIFMNTIVGHDGGLTAADRAPAPQGECFNPNNTSPVPFPPPMP